MNVICMLGLPYPPMEVAKRSTLLLANSQLLAAMPANHATLLYTELFRQPVVAHAAFKFKDSLQFAI